MNDKELSLKKLGYSEQQINTLKQINNKDSNNIIIAGKIGSFKSSTLKNLINNSKDN